jgi:hypothetical protein
MTHKRSTLIITALATTVVACADSVGLQQDTLLLDDAFSTVLYGFGNTFNSYDAGISGGAMPWLPSGPFMASSRDGGPRGGGGPGPRGPGGRGPGGGFMGGGLGGPFHGGFLNVRGFALPSACTFQAASGRVVCPTETRSGLTIDLSAAYSTASGGVQQAFDAATTNTVNTRVSVNGTLVRRDSSTTTVRHASDRTISGLAAGSTQRTINSRSAGTEETSGRNRAGEQFTAQRVMGDTVNNVVIPVRTDSTQTYPTSGTVIRSMTATLTPAGGTARTTTRREVITYNGTATATLVITQDGVTKNCTVALPGGRPVCQ